jgi:hypothetical protein
MAKAIRSSTLKCDVNAHLNCVIATEMTCGMVIWNTLLMSFYISLNWTLKISEIKLVSSKIPWLLTFIILMLVRVVVTGVGTLICKLA